MASKEEVLDKLREIVGPEAVRLDQAALDDFGSDMTENPACAPQAVIAVQSVEELQEIVRLAAAEHVPLTPRLGGTNLGGLTIPEPNGWALDLMPMNRILEINVEDQVAIIEPGVTFGQLRRAMDQLDPPLTIGYPLAPPEVSVAANCLLDGLGNLSLKHGAMGDWINGLEVVRADGTLLRTGSYALGVPVPYGRAPLPHLGGLFVSFQGTTGFISKLAVQLWPLLPHRERAFVLAYDYKATMRAIRELPKLDILHDVGSMSWPTGKMLFGVEHPKERDPAEPEFFFYLDMAAPNRELLDAKRRTVLDYIARLRDDGFRVEDPIDMPTLLRLEPRFEKFADFPTRLEFLIDNPGGGLSWVGTYGPMGRFESAYEAGCEIMARFDFPPIVVARPMKGGHFGVIRFIEVFNRRDPAECERVLACNRELCAALLDLGFVMYKTPAWAVKHFKQYLDPGFARLLGEVRDLLDPDRIMNPGRWKLD